MTLKSIESFVDHKIEDTVGLGFKALQHVGEMDLEADPAIEVNDFNAAARFAIHTPHEVSHESNDFFEEYKNEREAGTPLNEEASQSSEETDVEALLYDMGIKNNKNAESGINIRNQVQGEDTKELSQFTMKKETFVLNKLQQIVEKVKF